MWEAACASRFAGAEQAPPPSVRYQAGPGRGQRPRGQGTQRETLCSPLEAEQVLRGWDQAEGVPSPGAPDSLRLQCRVPPGVLSRASAGDGAHTPPIPQNCLGVGAGGRGMAAMSGGSPPSHPLCPGPADSTPTLRGPPRAQSPGSPVLAARAWWAECRGLGGACGEGRAGRPERRGWCAQCWRRSAFTAWLPSGPPSTDFQRHPTPTRPTSIVPA